MRTCCLNANLRSGTEWDAWIAKVRVSVMQRRIHDVKFYKSFFLPVDTSTSTEKLMKMALRRTDKGCKSWWWKHLEKPLLPKTTIDWMIAKGVYRSKASKAAKAWAGDGFWRKLIGGLKVF